MRFGDKIYYCKKEKGIDTFAAPKEIVLAPNYFSLQPSKSAMDIMVYGTDVENIYIALCPIDVWGQNTLKSMIDSIWIMPSQPMMKSMEKEQMQR